MTPMTAHEKRHTSKIEEEHSLAQKLQQQFLETAYHFSLEMPKVEAGVVPPPTRAPPEMESHEERRRGTRSTYREGDGGSLLYDDQSPETSRLVSVRITGSKVRPHIGSNGSISIKRVLPGV